MPSDILTIVLSAFATNARPPTVRPVSPTDESELVVLYLRSYPPDIGAQDLDEARAEIRATFAGEFGVLRLDSSFVAVDSGRVVGAVLVVERSIWDDDLDGPFIIDLFVDPDARGRGHGRRLVEAALAACAAQGDERLSLRFGEGTSPAAFALYESLGFEERVS
ncbi:MAG TPA: GNAT family N-acetyltransferase [Arachnia sp.]|nr:GNAT family N-acetyltransferase [Arachnia sp.]